MMILQMFVLAVIETSSTIILWNAIGIKKNSNILKNGSIVILMSIIIALTNNLNIYISMTINYLSLITMIKLMFNKRFIDAFYEFCIIALMSCIIQLVYTIPIMIVFNTISERYYFDQGLLVTLLTLVTSIIIYKYVPLDKLHQKFNYSIKKAYIWLANILLYVLISKSIWEYNKDLLVNNILLFIIIPIIFITINVIYFKYSIKITEQKKMAEMYDKYSPIMLNLIEEVRRKQHDFKNHMNAIYGISEVSNGNDIKENIQKYIMSLNESLKKIEKLVVINHQILAAIIYSKICEAEKNNIDISFDIKLENQNLVVNDYELTEIITNLLDNAFEAVYSLQENEREVAIVVLNKAESLYMEVTNKGEPIAPHTINKIFNKGFTTKSIQGHGYGLYNIKKIVEHYNGEIQLSNDNGYNTFKIYFNKLSGISGSPQNQSDAE